MNNVPENSESFEFAVNPTGTQHKKLKLGLLTCITIASAILPIIGSILLVIAVLGVVIGSMRASTPYQEALLAVQTDAKAVELLGEPIEAGWFTSGSLSTSSHKGEASLRIPVSGPRGKGAVFVEAHTEGGIWQYTTLYLRVDGEPHIPLSLGR